MKNLALVMFSGQTHLDFVGFYDCMLRLKAVRPQFEMRFCSRERQVSDSGGLTIDAGEITTDLGGFDAVFCARRYGDAPPEGRCGFHLVARDRARCEV